MTPKHPVATKRGLLLTRSPVTPAERSAEKRRIRKHQVLDCIRKEGPIARSAVARNLGFNLPTVSRLVDELVDEGLAIEAQAQKTPLGRRPIPVSLKTNAACVMGIDLGKITTIGLMMDLKGGVIARHENNTPPMDSPQRLADWVAQVASELLALAGGSIPPLAGAGVALPGLIHRPDRLAQTLAPDAQAVNDRLSSFLDVPVLVDNDTRMMAHGILWFGPPRNLETFAVVNIGHGLGMALVIGRKVYPGFHGHAGEIGHIPLGEQGIRCYCGSSGCLENIASGSGLERMAMQAGLTKNGGKAAWQDLAEMARAGSADALAIFERFGHTLGRGLGAVSNLFNPQAIILAGRVVRASDLFIKPMFDEINTVVLPAIVQEVKIDVSELYEDAGPLGTCACVLQHIFSAAHISVESVV
ncbi:MAG: ROK family transcriptional regulator [bacterium]|nr:ROK family transcriptional regulator [Candidatus Sumerlaeota bacterium]